MEAVTMVVAAATATTITNNHGRNETVDINDIEAPTYLISDYIEIAYLGIVIMFGIPSNVIILRKLLNEQRISSNRDFVKSGFLMLKINLNITDLFILSYALGKLFWLITYQWVGGDFLCRFYQMFSMLSLYSSSNIVVCIALDRLRNVLCANKIQTKSKKINTVTVLAVGSWIFALICSLPQFFLFQTIEVYPNFVQCTDIWQIARHSDNDVGFERGSFVLSEYFENGYNIVHLTLVFWGPLLTLIITYAWIATKLMKYSLNRPGVQSARRSFVTTNEESAKEMIIHINLEDGLLKPKGSTKRVVHCSGEDPANFNNPSRTKTSKRKSKLIAPDSTINESSTATSMTTNTSRLPTWRKQLRSRVFRTTMLVILTHFLFWFPYNALGLMKYINQPTFELLSANANIFKDLQILITLINPFLYGFS